MISVLLNQFKCVLWPRIWSTLVNCGLEKDCVVSCCLLMSIRSSWFIVLLRASVSLLIFLSTRSVVTASVVEVFNFFPQVLLQVFWFLVRYTQVQDCYVFLENWPLYYHIMTPFIPNYPMKSALSEVNVVTLAFFWLLLAWKRKWQPTPVFLPGESQGWGSLVGCRLWGHTESDTTEAT